MKKIKNIKTLVAALVLIVGIVGVGSTVALITTNKTIVNTFTAVTEIDTDIEENIDPDNVSTGTDILKQPYVVNKTSVPTLIRARVTISPSDLDVTLKSGTWKVNGAELNAYEPASLTGTKSFSSTGTVYSPTGSFSDVTDSEGKGWIYSNGWYYYNVVTAAGTDYANTTTLFDAVFLGEDVPADAQIDITVYQEAVHASGYSAGTVVEVSEIEALFE